jgi:predicted ATP-dependent endonuclease of OLD family
MRLHKLQIKNFRLIKDCTILFRDATFLIGPNNTGKSSIFSAIDYLHKNTNVDREDYSKTYDQEEEEYVYEDEIEIIAEYHNLPEESENWVGFRGRVITNDDVLPEESNRKIIYKKVWSINQSKPKIYMLEYERNVSATYQAANTVNDLIGDDFDEEFLSNHFGPSNLNKGLNTAKTREKLTDLPQYWEINQNSEPEWIENPGGIPGNVTHRLPRVVTIPAESCITELTSAGGALFTILGDLFEQVRTESDNYEQAQHYLNELAAELDPDDQDTNFGQLIEQLNSMTHRLFPDSAVHVSASLAHPEKSIKPEFNVEMESNVRTTVNYQGHGMIRATAFQLLRYIQDFVNQRATAPRSTIYCFEEPEIYLHPSASNQMRDAIYELSGPGCQIISTTHSPYMINLGSEKAVSLCKFSLNDSSFTSTHSLNLQSAMQSLQEDEKQNLKMLLKIDDYISRMFFTKKAVFVEGDTEEVVIRETLLRLDTENRSRVIGNIEFLRARGKPVLISIAKYLNALGIDYFIVHDRDNGNEKAESYNDHILEQTGDDKRLMLEECIEDVLGYDAPTSEKPFKAYDHIKNNWGETFSDIPNNWQGIFKTICAPYLDQME